MATLSSTYLPLDQKLINESNKGLSAVQTAGGTYAVRDSNARSAISGIIGVVDELSTIVQGGVHYRGKTTTALTDGATTNPITVNGSQLTAQQGDLVILDSGTGGKPSEFIWNGSQWSEFGAGSALKALAFKDSASGTTSQDGALTVDLSNAVFSGNVDTISASFSGTQITGLGASFAGTAATLTANVATQNTDLTVNFSNASVSVLTSVSTNAISAAPDLSVKTTALTEAGVSAYTAEFTRLTAATTSSLAVGTSWTGNSTTFTGTFTPAGGITPASPNLSISLSGVAPNVTFSGWNGSKPTGTIDTSALKPVGTVSKPNVTVTPSSGSFLNSWSATVSESGVLSFSSGSGNALTGVTAALSTAPTFTGTSISGAATFCGTGMTGTPDIIASGWSGTPDVGFAGWDGDFTFSGSLGNVNVSGTPSGTLNKTTLNYVKEVDQFSGQVAVTGGTTNLTAQSFVTGVSYNGAGKQAKVTLTSGTRTATGNQTLTYAKPLSVSISYTPSGTVTVDDFTPAGSITGQSKATGTITGTQTFSAHSHTVTVS